MLSIFLIYMVPFFIRLIKLLSVSAHAVALERR